MQTTEKKALTVKASIDAPVSKVWEYFTEPAHLTKWNFASPDWHAPKAENDLRKDGKFSVRMEAKDGSMGFDFGGIYTQVEKNKTIAYIIGDGRIVSVQFVEEAGKTTVTETFEAETTNSLEMQQAGWQAILDNFKKYTEEN